MPFGCVQGTCARACTDRHGYIDCSARLWACRAVRPALFRSTTSQHTEVRRGLAPVRAVSVGDKLPNTSLKYFDAEGNMKEITVEELTKNKKVHRGLHLRSAKLQRC